MDSFSSPPYSPLPLSPAPSDRFRSPRDGHSFSASPPHRPATAAAAVSPPSPRLEIDMTSTLSRHKARAALTLLHQVHALLRDIRARPSPSDVSEDFVPYEPPPLHDEDDLLAAAAAGDGVPAARSSGLFDDSFLGDDGEEDGRSSFQRVLRTQAALDPRWSSVQGLVRHIDSLVLTQPSSSFAVAADAASAYPSWIGPQLTQIWAIVNDLFPSAAHARAIASHSAAAEEFKRRESEAFGAGVDARAFQRFLDRSLASARGIKGKLHLLAAAHSGGDGGGSRGASLAVSPMASRSSLRSARHSAAGGDDDDNDDPFAAHAAAGTNSPPAEASTPPRKRPAAAKQHKADTPASPSAPSHPRPFGWGSHKKKRIGDAPEPVERSTRYDGKPRKAPGLLDPRPKQPNPHVHTAQSKAERSRAEQEERREKRDREEKAWRRHEAKMQAKASGGAHGSDAAGGATAPTDAGANDETDGDDDDPFAAHSSTPCTRTQSRSSTSAHPPPARQARAFEVWRDGGGGQQREEESKQQPAAEGADYTAHRPAALLSDEDLDDAEGEGGGEDDDPFSPSPKPATRTLSRPSDATAAARAEFNLPSPSTVARIVLSPSSSQVALSRRPSSSTASRSASRRPSTLALSAEPSRSVSRRPSTATTTAALSASQSLSASRRPSTSTTAKKGALSSKNPSAKSLHSSPTAASAPRSPTAFAAPAAAGLSDEPDWRSVELKLASMQLEIRSARSDMEQSFRAAHAAAGSAADDEYEQSASDMGTAAWEGALHQVLAGGKRIVPSATPAMSPTAGAAGAGGFAGGGNEALLSPSSTAHESKLSSEKAQLEHALAELQARDQKHAEHLFLLMERLNTLPSNGGAGGSMANTARNGALGSTRRGATGGGLSSSRIPPALSTSPSSASLPRPIGPLGTAGGHGTRSLRLPSPDDIEFEASFDDSVVLTSPPRPDAREKGSGEASEPGDAHDAQVALMEVHARLDLALASQAQLKAALDAATIEAAVSARSAEAAKLFMAHQLASNADSERQKELMRTEAARVERQAALRTIQGNERRIQEMKEEQRLLRNRFDQDRSAMQSNADHLLAEVESVHVAAAEHASEAATLRAKIDQIHREQEELQASKAASTRTERARMGGAVDRLASQLESPEGDFFSFVAASFQGDYLKTRQNAALTHIIDQQAQIACAQKTQTDDLEEVLFSDYVTKYNRSNGGDPRVLLLTSHALYLFTPKKLELRRRFPLSDLKRVSLSRLCTEVIVLHSMSHADLLLTSPKRPELIFHLQNAVKALHLVGRESLAYAFSERLYVKGDGAMVRDIAVLDSQSFKISKPMEMHGSGAEL